MNLDSPIEKWLDELVVHLGAIRPRELRSLLAEAEAHLRDDVAAGVAAGLSELQAERDAVQRFGAPHQVALAERRTWRPPLPVLAHQTIASAMTLGGIGAIAVGVSGVIALVLRTIAGSRAVIDATGPLAAGDCARWLSLDPSAPDCRSAAIHDWANEVVWYRIAFGLLGIVAVVAAHLWRRRMDRRSYYRADLPSVVTDTIAAVAFTAAAVWLAGLGIDRIVVAHGDGSGQWLSAVPIALLGAIVFCYRLVRDLREPTTTSQPHLR